MPSRNPWQCPFHLPNCWSFFFLLWLLLTQFRDLIASALAQMDWQNPVGIQLNISAMILMDGKAFRAGSAARISSNSSSFSLTGAAPCGPRGCRWWESGSPPHTSGAVGITLFVKWPTTARSTVSLDNHHYHILEVHSQLLSGTAPPST